MFASLPMYDWPEIREATDQFWSAIADHFGVAVSLSHDGVHSDDWRRDDLVFSQTCGYPFTHDYRGQLTYVATPHYVAEGCEGPNYCSFIFAREARRVSQFKGMRGVVNASDSMSGMLALRLAVPGLQSEVESGAHVESLRMVQEGQADVCAIDAICVALARRHRPWLLEGLVEVARSPSVPGLPFVTRARNVSALQQALAKAMADPRLASARQAMLLTGHSVLPVVAYDEILALEGRLQK